MRYSTRSIKEQHGNNTNFAIFFSLLSKLEAGFLYTQQEVTFMPYYDKEQITQAREIDLLTLFAAV